MRVCRTEVLLVQVCLPGFVCVRGVFARAAETGSSGGVSVLAGAAPTGCRGVKAYLEQLHASAYPSCEDCCVAACSCSSSGVE